MKVNKKKKIENLLRVYEYIGNNQRQKQQPEPADSFTGSKQKGTEKDVIKHND